MSDRIEVTKASGEREPFDVSKLRRSLRRAGASDPDVDAIVDYIRGVLVEGISTRKIYKQAFEKLREISEGHAARYRIKEALFELGPSGLPFERFVAELLRRQGFETTVGVTLKGKCVSHEVDVIAEKEQTQYIIECKFHNRPGYKCDVKVPLYIHSRFQDIYNNRPDHKAKDWDHKGWLVTNTRFSGDAKEYGTCVGLKMLSWDYPQGQSIREMVGEVNLHPVTCLSGLSKSDKEALIDREVIFCSELMNKPEILTEIGLQSRDRSKIMSEVEQICHK